MPKSCRIYFTLWLAVGPAAAWLPAATNAVPPTRANYTIKSWGTKEGLPQSAVIAMTQTRDGYLWLGTLNGLVRFDGIRFTVFDEGNTPELG
ncbi:MAG: two-component regulator propeller domain-containing protein, partial [Verrucomicrobiota bacterium]